MILLFLRRRSALSRLFRGVALVLALDYFSFQVELFDEEYEANHPRHRTGESVSSPTLTWESFDKDNAPPPYAFDAIVTDELIGFLPVPAAAVVSPHHPFRDLRDKSPPSMQTS